LSTQTTSQPRLSSCSHKCEPRNPAPPVTSTRFSRCIPESARHPSRASPVLAALPIDGDPEPGQRFLGPLRLGYFLLANRSGRLPEGLQKLSKHDPFGLSLFHCLPLAPGIPRQASGAQLRSCVVVAHKTASALRSTLPSEIQIFICLILLAKVASISTKLYLWLNVHSYAIFSFDALFRPCACEIGRTLRV
jgi:hypothetical protein